MHFYAFRITCLMAKYGKAENLLDVMTHYEILGDCRLD
jgi:hypothetical protein